MVLRAWAILVAPVIVILAVVACHHPIALSPAELTTRAANAALPVLVDAYRSDGDRAIDSATDQVSAVIVLGIVRQRWAPVWRAWDHAREAQARYLAAPDDGAELLGAWCSLAALAPVPLLGGPACPPR